MRWSLFLTQDFQRHENRSQMRPDYILLLQSRGPSLEGKMLTQIQIDDQDELRCLIMNPNKKGLEATHHTVRALFCTEGAIPSVRRPGYSQSTIIARAEIFLQVHLPGTSLTCTHGKTIPSQCCCQRVAPQGNGQHCLPEEECLNWRPRRQTEDLSYISVEGNKSKHCFQENGLKAQGIFACF